MATKGLRILKTFDLCQADPREHCLYCVSVVFGCCFTFYIYNGCDVRSSPHNSYLPQRTGTSRARYHALGRAGTSSLAAFTSAGCCSASLLCPGSCILDKLSASLWATQRSLNMLRDDVSNCDTWLECVSNDDEWCLYVVHNGKQSVLHPARCEER